MEQVVRSGGCGSTGRVVVLSPHLDDAVLSCGGWMTALAGVRVEVWTLFAGAPWWGGYSPLAQWLHQVSGARGRALARIRRREDRNACRVLGVGWRHFHWRDAVYRRRRDGSFSYETGRQLRWVGEDEELVDGIAGVLARRMGDGDRLVVPLGVGRHVDHLIGREAAERSGVRGLSYYIEFPYGLRHRDEVAALVAGMEMDAYEVDSSALERWVRGVACYRSQLPMLEEAVGPVDRLIEASAAGGGLGLYRRVAGGGLSNQ